MKPELLTLSEFSQATSVSRSRIYELLNSGQIKAVKMGNKTLIPYAALTEFLASLSPYKNNSEGGAQ